MKFFPIGTLPMASALLALTLPLVAQVPATTAEQAPPAATPAPTTPVVKNAVPDYPDPRTFTVGVFYWFTGPGEQPSLVTGRKAADFSDVPDLGKPKKTPGIFVSIPISRTGEIKAEGFIAKGDATQLAVNAPIAFGTPFTTGATLNTQFKIQSARIYLDDLLFPHKFPVAKFRLKSLWGVEYLRVKSTIDNPPITTGLTSVGSHTVVLPMFGVAAEYAIAPHVLFRVAGSGFGIYHKSDIWDAEATISYRAKRYEIIGGGRALHFKTSPQGAEYFIGTLAGAFVGVRYHW